jgi:hypothetical protein
MATQHTTHLPYSFNTCPCCGRETMSGERGICPVSCSGYEAACAAREAAKPAGVDLDDIELEIAW